MTFLISAALAASLTLIQPSHQGGTCQDPATPLQTLAANYDRWPPPPPGNNAKEAWQKASTYFKTADDHDYHKAVLAYENLQRDFPRDLHTKFVLGILYSTGPDLYFPGSDGYRHVAITSFSNADTRAVRNMQAVMQADSTQWIAAVAVTRNALVTTEKNRVAEARALITRGLTADPSSVPLHLAWSDLLIKEGRQAEALAYIKAHNGSCAAQQHARAEALMLTGDTATGTRLYLETLSKAEPDEIDRFYDDVRVMMTIGQNKAYRALPPEKKAPWLLAYWNRTAAASGRTVQTRVAEQTIRAAYADANFRAYWYTGQKAMDRLAVISDTSHVVPWNAAGVFYVRHGPPDVRYNSADGALEIEAWVWRQMEPPTYVMLSRSKAPVDDWRADVTPTCSRTSFLGGFDPAEAREHIRTGNSLTVREMFFALGETIDPTLVEWIHECQLHILGVSRIRYGQLMTQYAYDNTRLYRKLVQAETSLPHFRPGVRIAVNAYQFRSDTREPEIIALPAIPIVDLRNSASRVDRLRIGYTVTDSLVASFATDTTVALPPNAMTGLVRVPMTWRNPGITNGSLRVTVTDPADTLTGTTRSIPFNVRPENDNVALSDIVIADAGVNGPLVRGTYRLSPLPDHRVRDGDTFRVFFELYGLTPGEKMETSIHLKRTDQKTIKEQLGLSKRDEKTITFTSEAVVDPRGVAVSDVEMTGELVKGTYSVDVTVTLARGVVAKRTGVLVVE